MLVVVFRKGKGKDILFYLLIWVGITYVNSVRKFIELCTHNLFVFLYAAFHCKVFVKKSLRQVWWYMPVIPAIWEAEVGGLKTKP
jgi:hypothetical protein